MSFLVLIWTFAALFVAPLQACLGGGGGGGGASTNAPSYQVSNALPPAATQTTPLSSGSGLVSQSPAISEANCGHSKYWNSGQSTLTGASIVGGVPAMPNEFPYQARLSWKRSAGSVCGAAIISKTFVITAAHCCQDIYSISDVTVIVGDHNKSVVDTGEMSLEITEMIIHPDYASDTQNYDFCLLRVATRMTWNQQVQPVCLPASCSQQCVSVNANGTADNGMITGWGAVSELDAASGRTPEILQKARVQVVSTATCADSYSQIGQVITDQMICAGYSAGGIDTCQGDSGGPLVCYKNGYYQLDGITSFGSGCARERFYGVYARTCTVLDWIGTMLASNLTTTTSTTTTTTTEASTSSDDAGGVDEVRVLGFAKTSTTARPTRGRLTTRTTTPQGRLESTQTVSTRRQRTSRTTRSTTTTEMLDLL